MRNLLSAGLYRLVRSKAFYAGIAASVLLELWVVFVGKQDLDYGRGMESQGVFYFGMFLPLVLSPFCGLFFGADYACGTLRNKLISGYSKAKVYGTNLILACGVGVCFYTAAAGIGVLCGLGMGETFQLSPVEIFTYFLGSLVMVLGAVSLSTLLGNLFTNRSIGIVVSLLLAVGLLFFAGNLSNTMNQPATIPQVHRFEQVINGSTIVGYEPDLTLPPVPNPDYPQGAWRMILTFIWNFLPACQGMQFSEATVALENFLPMLGYMAAFIALTTGVGIILFQRRDVK